MNQTIKIKKGLDLPIDGKAAMTIVDARGIGSYAVKPPDVTGFTPRLLVSVGDSVAAGQPLVADKNDPRLTLPAPVDGTVVDIVRGEKRKLLEVVVSRNNRNNQSFQNIPINPINPTTLSPACPCWWMLRERPFGTIANPDHTPKGIYVSLRDTNPLAPDLDYAMRGCSHEFEAGLQALEALAPVHAVRAKGPHPAGNIGTIVATLDPINKGECIWHIGAQDVASLGHWCLTGEYRPERVVAVGGPAAKEPHYYRMLAGACIEQIANAQTMHPNYPKTYATTSCTRIVSGSPLSGTRIADDGYLGMYDQQLTLLPEGDHYDFMGWLMPGFDKYSFSKTFVSGMLRPVAKMLPRHPRYNFDTNVHGSVRPFLFTGQFERVFPFDIYPMLLIKACIVGDVELQEKLGIYEVEPEDFALCEYIDPSKTEIQTIIREALEILRKEATA